ncbi:hypothetical protein ACIGW7_16815 [Streptomyces sp. NPDC053253]|uniref:hypothetical protein n=1 Tax=unclassified Streptomyces TaxID=2593676 RepID=UPI0033240D1F
MAFDSQGGSAFLAVAVEAIQRYWAELYALLDPAAREELAEILEDAENDPVAAARDLRELIKPFTPPDHPARVALTPTGVRFRPTAGGPPPDATLLPMLRALRADALSGETAAAAAAPPDAPAPGTSPTAFPSAPPATSRDDDPYRPDADDAWLLASPAVPATELGLTPDQARDLIALTYQDDVERVPSFQLDRESGAPYPVVTEINRLLSADVDPWGAADWWLGSNVWLDAAPATLLGTGADGALLAAAQAETPDW